MTKMDYTIMSKNPLMYNNSSKKESKKSLSSATIGGDCYINSLL